MANVNDKQQCDYGVIHSDASANIATFSRFSFNYSRTYASQPIMLNVDACQKSSAGCCGGGGGGGGSYTPPRPRQSYSVDAKTDDSSKDSNRSNNTSKNKLDSLVVLQRADGSWALDSNLFDVLKQVVFPNRLIPVDLSKRIVAKAASLSMLFVIDDGD